MSTDATTSVMVAGNETCTDHYYYYENKKKSLGTVSADAIIIGFVPGLTATEKESFVATHTTYLKGKDSYETYDYTSPEIISLQPGLSCKQVEELLKVLNQSNLVRFANPTFMTSEGFRGIGGHFLVTLKSNGTYAKLEEYAKKTNTRIVEEISADLKLYLLEADKTSEGNALEMANAFHRQSFAQLGEPDFVLQPSIIGTW